MRGTSKRFWFTDNIGERNSNAIMARKPGDPQPLAAWTSNNAASRFLRPDNNTPNFIADIKKTEGLPFVLKNYHGCPYSGIEFYIPSPRDIEMHSDLFDKDEAEKKEALKDFNRPLSDDYNDLNPDGTWNCQRCPGRSLPNYIFHDSTHLVPLGFRVLSVKCPDCRCFRGTMKKCTEMQQNQIQRDHGHVLCRVAGDGKKWKLKANK
mmetsp:Transcript_5632/g.12256  ORF Transcript_5632/g.12256 Transcript_5632/m.12256 type:complete len:207 (-) Transcript_5632:247-867(-)